MLEVNVSPSLSSSSPLDKKIKTTLMCDVFNLVGFIPFNRKKIEKELDTQRQRRILGMKENKIFHKDINKLNKCRSLEEFGLTEEDVHVILDLEEESYRMGHF